MRLRSGDEQAVVSERSKNEEPIASQLSLPIYASIAVLEGQQSAGKMNQFFRKFPGTLRIPKQAKSRLKNRIFNEHDPVDSKC